MLTVPCSVAVPRLSLEIHGRVAFLPFAAVTRKSLIPQAFDSEPETLGQHVRRCRLSRGLTQDAVAAGLNISVATLLNWEKGKTQPADPSLPAIIAFLGYDAFPAATSLPERLQAARGGEWLVRSRGGSPNGRRRGNVEGMGVRQSHSFSPPL